MYIKPRMKSHMIIRTFDEWRVVYISIESRVNLYITKKKNSNYTSCSFLKKKIYIYTYYNSYKLKIIVFKTSDFNIILYFIRCTRYNIQGNIIIISYIIYYISFYVT